MGTQHEPIQWPRISIVTPSYNQARYLPETIESVLGQGYPNLEYIVIDGGSTDGSAEIIKRYEPRLTYWVSEKDGGQSEAINKGFNRCTGDLFNWINSDDVLFPGALRQVGIAYARCPDTDIVAGDHAVCSMDGRVTWISSPPAGWALSPRHWILGSGQQSTFVASRAYKRVGGVRDDLHISMDMDLYYRVLTTGGRRTVVRGVVGMIRKHDEAKGATSQGVWRDEETRLFQEHGISRRWNRIARFKLRCCRVLDGSYARSMMLLRRWQGRRPWENVAI